MYTYPNDDDQSFSPSSHGYPITYYPLDMTYPDYPQMAPFTLCAECAKAEWEEDTAARFHTEVEDSDNTLESAVICDGCNREIAPRRCRLCYDPLNEPSFLDNHCNDLGVWGSDYYAAHSSCIARAVVDHRQGKPYADPVEKVGKLAYRIGNHTYAPLERKELAGTA